MICLTRLHRNDAVKHPRAGYIVLDGELEYVELPIVAMSPQEAEVIEAALKLDEVHRVTETMDYCASDMRRRAIALTDAVAGLRESRKPKPRFEEHEFVIRDNETGLEYDSRSKHQLTDLLNNLHEKAHRK